MAKVAALHTGKGINTTGHRYWQRGSYVWNNDRDTAYLRNSSGTLDAQLLVQQHRVRPHEL